jgi:hypothetical protein
LKVLSLIEVREPYFALTELELDTPGRVSAHILAEQPRGHELGALPAAEAGRHLAIAGSCACASLQADAGKHFYLANRAHLRRVTDTSCDGSGLLRVDARAVQRDRRQASAECVLRDRSGHTLYALDVSYRVLQERVFQRLFSAHRQELRRAPRDSSSLSAPFGHLRANPYREAFPFVHTRLDGEHGGARLAELPAHLCAGHFPLYPAMPVAVLMYGLSSLSGDVLRAQYGELTRYHVQDARVQADNLAFAGQSLDFRARWLGRADNDDLFEASATLDDGTVVGAMQLTLRRQEGSHAIQ